MWEYINVLNVGVQLLGLMLLGWLCARIRVLDEPRLTQSLGTLVMKVMLPSFVVYRVGIKMDLLQPENWLALSCFVLWTALLHGATLAYCWLLRRRDLGEAGFVGLLLTANNYGVSGFAMMAATFGAVGAELSLLTAVVFIAQVLPFSLLAFEWRKWLLAQHGGGGGGGGSDGASGGGGGSGAAGGGGAIATGYDTAGLLRDDAAVLTLYGAGGSSVLRSRQMTALPQQGLVPDGPAAAAGGASTSINMVSSRGGTGATGDGTMEAAEAGRSSNAPCSLQMHAAPPAATPPSGPMSFEAGGGGGGNADIEGGVPGTDARGGGHSFAPAPQWGDGDSVGGSRGAPPLSGSALPRSPFSLLPPSHPVHEILEDLNRRGSSLDYPLGGSTRSSGAGSSSLAAAVMPAAAVMTSDHHHHHRMASKTLPPEHAPSNTSGFGAYHLASPAASGLMTPRGAAGFDGGGGGGGSSNAALQAALKRAYMVHGGPWSCFLAFLHTHPVLAILLRVVLSNHLLWFMALSLVISLSGLREYLDPEHPRYFPPTGWIAGCLSWLSSTLVPLSLVSNGVWMYGRRLWSPGAGRQVAALLAAKLLAAPLLMLGVARLLRLDGARAMSCVLLTLTPIANVAFVVVHQYDYGTEVASMMQVAGTVLLLPAMLAYLRLVHATGLYDVDALIEAASRAAAAPGKSGTASRRFIRVR